MPQKIVQDDGTEVEVFTAAEVEEQAATKAAEIAQAKITEETERIRSEQESVLLEKEEELERLKAEHEKLQKKDLNFETLRKSKAVPVVDESVKKEVEELKSAIGQIMNKPLQDAKTTFIKNSGLENDKDKLEVFEHFYSKLSAGAKTVEEVNAALTAAMNLTAPDVGSGNRINNSVRISDNFYTSDGSESQESKEIGAALGLSSEDKKAYSGIVKAGGVVPLFAKVQK